MRRFPAEMTIDSHLKIALSNNSSLNSMFRSPSGWRADGMSRT
jgi:hypothetical protein